MKKITLLAVAFVAISFASCKKDRTCTCTSTSTTTTSGGSTTSTGDPQVTKITKVKKADAGCYDRETTTTGTGYTNVTTDKCSLS